MNKIYQGDNLEVMRSLESESIDLIATDPPYNSSANYKNLKTGVEEFQDRWNWNEESVKLLLEMEELAFKNEDYSKALNTLNALDIILGKKQNGKKGQMRCLSNIPSTSFSRDEKIIEGYWSDFHSVRSKGKSLYQDSHDSHLR